MKWLLLALLTLQATAEPRVVAAVPQPITSLDPFSIQAIDAYWVMSQVLEPLVRVHPKDKRWLPCLATKWRIEGARVHVDLRRNVVFHNGEPLTSQDVVATYRAYFQPEFKAEVWAPMFSDVESIEAKGPHKVVIKLKAPHYLNVENILTSLKIMPKSQLKVGAPLVGTGAFRVEVTPQGFELRPHTEWWGPHKPKFRLAFKTVSDAKLAEMMLPKGELDHFVPSSSEALKPTLARVVRSRSTLGQGLWLDLNLRRPLFQNARVREALVLLWDRARLNQTIYGGRQQLALDTFSPHMRHYPPGEALAFDLKRATQILGQEGWRDSDGDGVLDQNGQPFRFTALVSSQSTERWISLFQRDAQKAGVRVDLKRIDEAAQLSDLLRRGQFDAVTGQGGVSESVHSSTWHSKGSYNLSGFSDANVDAALESLEKEFDLNRRQAKERELIKMVRSKVPQLPGLYDGEFTVWLSRRLDIDLEFPQDASRWRLID